MIYKEEKLDPNSPMRVGPNIFYKCSICNDQIPSLPINAGHCSCYNIKIDTDAGRISITDFDNAFRVRAF